MSKERELLRRISSYSESRIPLHFIKEIQQLLAQPEQEPEFNFDLERMKAAIESPISDVTVDDLAKQVKQEPVAWIIVNKETGYRTQVSDLTPFLYHREIFEVIPLYTAPPKREPLSEDKLDVLAEANITDEGIAGYYLGFRDAEKYHGIGGGE